MYAEQRRIGLGEFDPYGRWVNDSHIGDRLYLALAPRILRRSIALQVGLYCLCVQWRAVVEDDAWSQLQGENLTVFVPGPFPCQLWSIVQLCIDIDELVTQRGKDDTADERPSLSRIEPIGVLLQTNAQGLRRGGCLHHRQGNSEADYGTQGNLHNISRADQKIPRDSSGAMSLRRLSTVVVAHGRAQLAGEPIYVNADAVPEGARSVPASMWWDGHPHSRRPQSRQEYALPHGHARRPGSPRQVADGPPAHWVKAGARQPLLHGIDASSATLSAHVSARMC